MNELKNASSYSYSNEFFDAIESRAVQSARAVDPVLRQYIHFTSVIDFGCGRGAWLKAFLEQGVSAIEGLDGPYVDQSKLLIPRECFRATDLSGDIVVEKKRDLAISLEVAEHLPRRAAAKFIHALCNASDWVLFAAAIPGQGGTHHVNEQWPEYWKDLFNENGFSRLDVIRAPLLFDERVAPCYKQNMFLFGRRPLDDRMQRLFELSEKLDIEILMKRRLVSWKSASGVARELALASARALKQRLRTR